MVDKVNDPLHLVAHSRSAERGQEIVPPQQERYEGSATRRSLSRRRLSALRALAVVPFAGFAALSLSSFVATEQGGVRLSLPPLANASQALVDLANVDLGALAVAVPESAEDSYFWSAASIPPPADLEAERATRESVLALTAPDHLLEARALAERAEKVMRVRRGDTLMSLLTDAGIPREDALSTVDALRNVYDPRRIWAGQQISLHFDPLSDAPVFRGLSLDRSYDRRVVVAKADDGGFVAKEERRALHREHRLARATITSSLFEAGAEEGVPAAVLVELIRAYSYEVDFQREIRTGDSFEILYEEVRNDAGEVVPQGNIAYANLVLGGKAHRIFAFTPKSGIDDYFQENGQSVRKALLRTPVDGARISSRFGKRRHPVLGYTKIHKGLDFAAPTGTPIYAAGDGIVERANRYGSYGNYVRLRHSGTYKTAYAHLHRFASGMRAGKRVKQGQVIGYVGTTGRSTGPHLHYEVHVDGRQVNPLGLKLPAGEKLKGKDLDNFRVAKADIERLYASLGGVTRLAQKGE